MKNSYGQYLRKRLIEFNIATPFNMEGCSKEEIIEIQNRQGVSFMPEIYRQFLMEMGKSAGGETGLFMGEEYECSALMTLKQTANDDLEFFNRQFRIPTDAFVFLSHQGYQYWYFHTANHDEDPPVFTCFEGEVSKVTNHLSEFFDNCIVEMKN